MRNTAHLKLGSAMKLVIESSGPATVKRICEAVQIAVVEGDGWAHQLDPLLVEMKRAGLDALPQFADRQAEVLAKDDADRAKAKDGRERREKLKDEAKMQEDEKKRMAEEEERQRSANEKQLIEDEKKLLEARKLEFEAEKNNLEQKKHLITRRDDKDRSTGDNKKEI